MAGRLDALDGGRARDRGLASLSHVWERRRRAGGGVDRASPRRGGWDALVIIIGIDPGVSGAIAVITPQGANVWDTPLDAAGEYDIEAMATLIARNVREWESYRAFLEDGVIVPNRVDGRPEFRGQSAKSTARQWRGIGIWEGILGALGVPYELVPPATWKRALGVTRDKQTSRDRARELFPAAAHLIYRAKDDGRAEALLVAEFGRRKGEQSRLAV